MGKLDGGGDRKVASNKCLNKSDEAARMNKHHRGDQSVVKPNHEMRKDKEPHQKNSHFRIRRQDVTSL